MSIFTTIEATAANAILPGSGILVKLWSWIKPLLPYLAIAAAVVALLVWIDHRGYARGRAAIVAKYQPKLDKALAAELAGVRSITVLRAAIDQQNASIRTLSRMETDRLAAAQAALAVARSHDRARAVQIARLTASAGKTIPGAPCEASQAAKDAWK